jgi:spermidine/putrescine transport system permease protein
MILTDNGPVLGPLKSAGLLPDNYHLLGTATAVIGGLVYNYLPFMVLPIYVAVERIDPRIVEAARDLYANPAFAFRKVILPLSLPGVFAGALMTFVPTSTDYVNSSVLGSSSTTMIGQVIQAQYLQNSDYPTASALSFVLMAVMLVGIFAYARALGTADVMEVAAG